MHQLTFKGSFIDDTSQESVSSAWRPSLGVMVVQASIRSTSMISDEYLCLSLGLVVLVKPKGR